MLRVKKTLAKSLSSRKTESCSSTTLQPVFLEVREFADPQELIHSYVKKYGDVEDYRVYFEQLSEDKTKGYGFVLYVNPESLTSILQDGSVHYIGEYKFECKQNMLREEILKKKFDLKKEDEEPKHQEIEIPALVVIEEQENNDAKKKKKRRNKKRRNGKKATEAEDNEAHDECASTDFQENQEVRTIATVLSKQMPTLKRESDPFNPSAMNVELPTPLFYEFSEFKFEEPNFDDDVFGSGDLNLGFKEPPRSDSPKFETYKSMDIDQLLDDMIEDEFVFSQPTQIPKNYSSNLSIFETHSDIYLGLEDSIVASKKTQFVTQDKSAKDFNTFEEDNDWSHFYNTKNVAKARPTEKQASEIIGSGVFEVPLF